MSILLLPCGGDGQSFIDSAGAPRSGAQMFIYLAGTSTKATLYQDKAGAANHTNPIVLNTSGQVANGSSVVKPIFVDSGADYDVVLAPSNDTDPPVSPYFTLEDIEPVNDETATAIDQWILGGTPTYVSATSLTLAGDVTSTYHVGRRIKTTNSGGTIYSTITVSAYTTLTTLTVVNDSGTLDAGLSDIYYSILTATGPSVPGVEMSGSDWTHQGKVTIEKSTYWTKGADIASATSITLGTDGNYFDITGSTGPLATINCPAGMLFMLQFDSTPLLTYHATNLNLPSGGLDVQVAAGDKMICFATAANQVDVLSYMRASGKSLIAPLTSGTLTATTSGTSHDVTTIPAWVKRITIMFDRVSTNGTSIPLIQIGDSGGIEATNYNNAASYLQNAVAPSVGTVGTTGFSLGSAVNDAAHQIVGIATLALMDSSTNLWAFSFVGMDFIAPRALSGAGTKALSATLDRIRLTTVNGTDAFDNGSFNIMYE